MFATDVSPNRLERERLFVRRLLRELPGDRLGMVVFSGRAYVLSPLTVDHSALQLYLDALDPDIVSQGGSSLASALAQATDLARGPGEEEGTGRAVILVTDGEALEEEAAVREAADRAARAGVRVLTVGIGTEAGAPIPEIDESTGDVVGYKRDESGEIVISRLGGALLADIAERTQGTYVRLDEAGATEKIIVGLSGLDRETSGDGRRVERKDRFALFIAVALLLLFVDVLLSRARPVLAAAARMDAGRRVRKVAPRAAAVLVLFATTGFGIGDLERGNRLYREGRYAEAVEAYQAALAAGKTSPELHYNLGTALLRLGRYDEAQQALAEALSGVDPELRNRALYNLGNRFLEDARAGSDPQVQGKLLDSAIEAYKRALRMRPSDADAKWNLEMALRDQDKNEQQQQQQEQQDQSDQQQQQQDQSQQDDQDPARGGGGGGQDQPRDRDNNPRDGQMTQDQADRVLSAVEQDERQLTKDKLRKGQRRTAVRRDW
jgi:Ca-activated chloride channel family protein